MPSLPSSYATKGIGLVSDRKGVPVSASRRVGGLERLQARLAPGLGVTGVVDLVEDDQRLALLARGCGAAWAARRRPRR